MRRTIDTAPATVLFRDTVSPGADGLFNLSASVMDLASMRQAEPTADELFAAQEAQKAEQAQQDLAAQQQQQMNSLRIAKMQQDLTGTYDPPPSMTTGGGVGGVGVPEKTLSPMEAKIAKYRMLPEDMQKWVATEYDPVSNKMLPVKPETFAERLEQAIGLLGQQATPAAATPGVTPSAAGAPAVTQQTAQPPVQLPPGVPETARPLFQQLQADRQEQAAVREKQQRMIQAAPSVRGIIERYPTMPPEQAIDQEIMNVERDFAQELKYMPSKVRDFKKKVESLLMDGDLEAAASVLKRAREKIASIRERRDRQAPERHAKTSEVLFDLLQKADGFTDISQFKEILPYFEGDVREHKIREKMDRFVREQDAIKNALNEPVKRGPRRAER